jgi:hypothetical protein
LTDQSHFMLILPASECAPPPPRTKGGGTLSPAVEANSDDWRKSLAFCLLCAMYKRNTKSANQMNFTVHCTVYSRINSVKSLYAVTSTPYNECTRLHQLRTMNVRSCRLRKVTFIQLNQRIFWTNRVHSLYGVDVTA